MLPRPRWLKWFCEAGGSPEKARLEQTPYPFQPHSIWGSYYCRGGGLKSEQGAEPPSPLTLTTARPPSRLGRGHPSPILTPSTPSALDIGTSFL